MMKSSKSPKSLIPNIVLGSLLASLAATTSVARAAEPEVAPSAGNPAPGAAQRGLITVDEAPGVDLPPQIAADVQAAIEDALAGRAAPGTPIDVTLEQAGVVIRVGSLWRRVAIARWDYPAVRTVALHVLDLLQPAPEVPEGAAGNAIADPTPTVRATANQEATEPAGPWTLHAGVSGARGAQSPDPWIVGVTVGAAWSHDWLRIGLEIGWDHSIERHPDAPERVTVNYDAVPVRLVLAAQNNMVAAGLRAGVAGYRVTAQTNFREVTPLVGPFLALRLPIAGRFRGLLVGGFDYFSHRTELTTGGFDAVYSTPELAPYVGVIVEAVLRP
jgi:hypothetical protein